MVEVEYRAIVPNPKFKPAFSYSPQPASSPQKYPEINRSSKRRKRVKDYQESWKNDD